MSIMIVIKIGGLHMKGSLIVKNSLSKFKENELILASKLYKSELEGQITETAYYKTLERMCKSGELVKIAKGTYHLPKIGKYGIVPPSEKEIIETFTEKEKGTVVGYPLYNSLKLTTQVPKIITVMTSNLDAATKTIRNVMVKQVPIVYSEEIKNMIHALEVLENFYDIQDINYASFINYSKQLAETYSEKAFEDVINNINYSKSTIAFLREILSYYGTFNKLGNYLNTVSKYKYPKMEELYATARI